MQCACVLLKDETAILVFLSAVILPNRMQVVSASGAAKKAFSSPPFIASAFPQVCSVLSEPLHVVTATLVQLHVAAAVWVQPRVLVAAVEQLHVVAAAGVEPLHVVAAVVVEQLHVVAAAV